MVSQTRQGGVRLRIVIRTIFILLSILMVLTALGCGGGGSGADDSRSTTVSFSGSISAPDGVIIDSDVNDPNESYYSNDTLGAAQSVASPVSIGGYVNRANYGASGRSYSSGDLNDYFSIPLTAGDRIALAIGDPDEADLDLYLYDSGGTEIDASLSVDRYESLTVSDGGNYFIRVYAYSGASNYILTIGTDFDTGSADALSTQYDFIPGQAIVSFKDSVAAAAATVDRITTMGLTLTAGAAGREVLLTFDAQDLQAEAYRSLGVSKHLSADQATADAAMAEKINTLHVIKALRKRSDVRSASPNYILQHYATEPNDEYYHLQWHYPQINLPQVWDVTTGSSDVIVAVVDTGVLMDHPDLAGQLTDTGYDFISDPDISNDGDGIDVNPDDPGDSATAGASSFHGTHCAGTIAASTDNSTGVAGVSWNTRIMPVRVLGVGGGLTYDVLQGVRYAAGLSNDSGTVPDQTADIISMSLGGGGYSSATQDVYTAVRNAGVIVIAAAGNESTSTPSYPASYDGVVSVSAVNINGTLASYSNYGNKVDVTAPGGDSGDYNGDGYSDRVWSTCGDDSSGDIQFNYAAYNGTSMATPHVAGVVALMKALNPTMTPAQLDAWLQNGDLTNDIGDAGRDDLYGYGLIDAYKAVVAADDGSATTVLTISPTAVNLGVSGTTDTLTVSKLGDDAISVDGVVSSAAWLDVDVNSVDADGLGTYTVTASRSGLSDGTYSETITITPSSGSSITVPVNLQVRSTSTSADAGYHYILLADPDTLDVMYQDNAQAADGGYAFAFSDVTKADQNYLLIAGSDRDNDGYIDNAAEALGIYLSLDQITYVDASSDQSGLNFTTDLKLSLSASDLSADGSQGASPRFMRLR